MSYRETNKPPGHTLHDLRRRVSWLRIRLDTELEPPPLHGCGEVLDVLVWGTLRRTREPIRAQVLDLAREIAALARTALPAAVPDIRVEPMPLEPAVFESTSGKLDEVRLRFRIVATTGPALSAWRAQLRVNLKALGMRPAGPPGSYAFDPGLTSQGGDLQRWSASTPAPETGGLDDGASSSRDDPLYVQPASDGFPAAG